MSYVALNPSFYQMLNPESAWHPGAEGWSVAPVPGWGENPALVGPARLAAEGLGLEISVSDRPPANEADKRTALLIGGAFVLVLGGIALLYVKTK